MKVVQIIAGLWSGFSFLMIVGTVGALEWDNITAEQYWNGILFWGFMALIGTAVAGGFDEALGIQRGGTANEDN
jgi:hypothetical protein